MTGHARVCAAVRDWQQGAGSPDAAAAVALREAGGEAGGDEAGARVLLRGAVEWWQYMGTFRDVNGLPIRRSA